MSASDDSSTVGDRDAADELERAKAGVPIEPIAVPTRARHADRGAPAWVAPLKIGVVMALLGGGVAFLLTSGESPFVYSAMVDEVAAAPADHVGRTLRVEGQLRNGSIRFREDPCEWRFVLEREGHEMPVEFAQCVVPDTFRDGMGISVVVEGELREDGSFVASQVIPRCPSRYEMDQRQQAGEAMPHAAPPETSSLPGPRPPS